MTAIPNGLSAGGPDGGEGIYMDGCSTNLIGGTVPGAGNIISGNSAWGLSMTNASRNVIQGNLIGTAADGVSPLPNGDTQGGFHSVEIGGGCLDNFVGGAASGAANRIAFAPVRNVVNYAGIRMRDGAARNLISGNAIFANGGLGIDLQGYGFNANDHCDGDSGANNLQNYPVLTQVVSGANLLIQGTFNSTANGVFNLQFFANPTCDSSGYGEGNLFLGEKWIVTSPGCSTNFVVSLPVALPAGYSITATATDSANNTSEFSQCCAVVPMPALSYALSPNRSLTFSWTNNPAGVVLKQTLGLSPPVVWTTVTNPPVLSNGSYVVTIPMEPTGRRFFILSLP